MNADRSRGKIDFMNPAESKLFAVIPAAGQSRRMGRAKLLLPIGERTVIARVLDVLRRAEITESFVVCRAEDGALQRAVIDAGGTPLLPPVPPAEMRQSVEFALRAIAERYSPQGADGWLLVPADHPLLDGELLSRLLSRWRSGDCPILIPTCGGRRGHPVLFRWRLAAEVFGLPQDVGLNQLVRRHGAEAVELETNNPAVLADLDTPEDYARLLEQERPA